EVRPRRARQREHAPAARDGDYLLVSACLDIREERLRYRQRAVDVDGHRFLEQLVVERAERLQRRIAADTGVVDQYVDGLAFVALREGGYSVAIEQVEPLDRHSSGCVRKVAK